MGHEVSLLGRAWHLDVIEKEGLRITGLWGEYRVKAFDLYRTADEVAKKHCVFDLIFLTVKSFDTEKAAQELVPFMSENTMLVSFQNGLGNIETILKRVHPSQFLAGRVIFGAEIRPGVVTVTVNADDIVLGALPAVTPKLSAIRVAHTLSLSRLPVRAVPNILTYIWSKVIYNCALNGICTILEIPYGKILDDVDARKQMEEVVRECYAVAQKKEITLDPPSAQEYLSLLIGGLIPKTASHYPSMLQDLRRGKRLDIDALNGAICRLGAEVGVLTPVNQSIANKVKTLVVGGFAEI